MLTRRALLRRCLAVPGAAAAARLHPAGETASGEEFAHGVASGDPDVDRVVLWTRVSGATGDASVRWTVTEDAAMRSVVTSGEAVAGPGSDHTLHVDVTGLAPATSYYYAFESDGVRSPVGRTRTAPSADDETEVRLGAASCSSYAAGPFTAYRALADADVDLVVHLGDYLYEAGSGPREDASGVPVTLADYRRRHARQRSDPDLRRLHAAHPVAAIWDDHDVAGNAWRHGADAHDPDEHGPWEERRAAALRAWLEWLPVRRPDPSRPDRIWRRLPLGGSAELVLLDTRHDGRDRQVSADDEDAAGALSSPERRLVSDEQATWLADTLRSSTARWRVIANQVVLTPLAFELPAALASPADGLGLTVDGKVVNPDAWDGYPAERERVLTAIAAAGPTVVLTGDVHSSWAFEVPGPTDEPVAVELVTPSITAAPFADIVRLPDPSLAPGVVAVIADQLPQVRWAELTEHGYTVVAFGADAAQCDWWHVDLGDAGTSVGASWAVRAGTNRLSEVRALGQRPAGPTATLPSPTPPSSETTTPAPDDGGVGGSPGLVAGTLAAGTAAVAGLMALRRRRHP